MQMVACLAKFFLCLYSVLLEFGVIPDFVNASPKSIIAG